MIVWQKEKEENQLYGITYILYQYMTARDVAVALHGVASGGVNSVLNVGRK